MASPGAVPFGLASTSAPSGTSAWTSLFFGIGRLRAAKRLLMWSSTASSSRNFLPSSCAIKSRVKSSEVGPRPPVVMIKSARLNASRTADWMSCAVSGTATWRVTT